MSDFDNMTENESITHQVEQWAKGSPLHNPVRDECCPDFSCCNPKSIMPEAVREKFLEAYRTGDRATQDSIMFMGLSTVLAGENVYIAGGPADES